MPIWEYDGAQALRNLRSQSHAVWSDETIGALGGRAHPEAVSAGARLRQDFFEPHVEAKFKMRDDESIFAVGSCFARALEERLLPRAYDVRSHSLAAFRAFASERKSGGRRPNGICNKYNVFSILQQFIWLDDAGAPPIEDTLLKVGNDLYQDPHVHPIHKRASLRRTIERREAVNTIFRRWRKCDVLVVTLGLTETWYDEALRCHLNVRPALEAVEKEPKRFKAMATTFQENLEALEALYDGLMKRCEPRFRIIVTVSPVALMATFGHEDVVVRNSAAKAALRAVAEEWKARHSNVDYFPAYEIVLNSRRSVALQADRAHVTFEASEHVANVFERTFVDAGKPAAIPEGAPRVRSYEEYRDLHQMLMDGRREDAQRAIGRDSRGLRAEMRRWENVIHADDALRKRLHADLWSFMGRERSARA
ncbi:MAG: GSCFA domain-containing protein [Vicinamibacteria bacterium]|nr:GSCFA domain-containing protein [Vicinamibacteria bacterium]